MKRQIKDLIHQKGINVFASVGPKNSIYQALEILDATNSSALLVVEDNILKGIFSEKDFARAVVYNNISLFANVEIIMARKIYYAEPHFTLEDCLQIMSKMHIRHLPILDKGQPIALVSMRHIMEVLVEDKETQIRDLTSYITGSFSSIDTIGNYKRIQDIPVYSASDNFF